MAGATAAIVGVTVAIVGVAEDHVNQVWSNEEIFLREHGLTPRSAAVPFFTFFTSGPLGLPPSLWTCTLLVYFASKDLVSSTTYGQVSSGLFLSS